MFSKLLIKASKTKISLNRISNSPLNSNSIIANKQKFLVSSFSTTTQPTNPTNPPPPQKPTTSTTQPLQSIPKPNIEQTSTKSTTTEPPKKKETPPPPPPPTPQPIQSKEDAKKTAEQVRSQIMHTPPRLMRLWYLAGAGLLMGSFVYFYNERDHAERQIESVLIMIQSPDEELRKKGLEMLERSQIGEIRLLSGMAQIPVPKALLIQRGTVRALVEALKEGNESNKHLAVVSLVRLTDEHDGRTYVAREALPVVVSLLQSSAVGSPLWVACSGLILKLLQRPDTANSVTEIGAIVSKMNTSEHPLGPLMAAKLASALPEETRSSLNLNLNPALSNAPSVSAVDAALRNAIPKEPAFANPVLGLPGLLHLNWAVFSGIVGSLYGRFRWSLKARLNGLSGKDVKKIVKKSHVGKYVFGLLSLDLIAQGLLALPVGSHVSLGPHFGGAGFTVPKTILGLPWHSAVPMIETDVLILGALWAIRRQRYIVLPLLIASLDKEAFLRMDFNVAGLMREITKLEELPGQIQTQFKQIVEPFVSKIPKAQPAKPTTPPPPMPEEEKIPTPETTTTTTTASEESAKETEHNQKH